MRSGGKNKSFVVLAEECLSLSQMTSEISHSSLLTARFRTRLLLNMFFILVVRVYLLSSFTGSSETIIEYERPFWILYHTTKSYILQHDVWILRVCVCVGGGGVFWFLNRMLQAPKWGEGSGSREDQKDKNCRRGRHWVMVYRYRRARNPLDLSKKGQQHILI